VALGTGAECALIDAALSSSMHTLSDRSGRRASR
jgi:hypothetical protein